MLETKKPVIKKTIKLFQSENEYIPQNIKKMQKHNPKTPIAIETIVKSIVSS